MGCFPTQNQQLWLSVAYVMCSHTAGRCRDFSSCLSSDCRAVGHWCKWCAGRIKVYWPWSRLTWHGECAVKNTKGLKVLTADISSSNLALDVSKMTSWFCLTPSQWCQTEDDLMNLSLTSAMSVGYWNGTQNWLVLLHVSLHTFSLALDGSWSWLTRLCCYFLFGRNHQLNLIRPAH
jgi:hypothetical protein